MSLVACYFTPHPAVIVPQVGGAMLEGVRATVNSMERLGEEVARLAPETIVVISPHAGFHRRHMGVGVSARYRGSLAQFGAPEVAIELEGNTSLGEAVLRDALARALPVLPLGMTNTDGELDHGTLVPLHFLLSSLPGRPRLLLLTFSLLGQEEHIEFGRAVGAAIEVSGGRTVFVASGDLSHRLTRDAPAGYTPRGPEFDERVREAFAAGDGDALVHLPATLADAAGECGYRSLLVLFGLLSGRDFRTRVLSYEGPFGVGYLVGAVDLDGPPPEAVDAQTRGAGA